MFFTFKIKIKIRNNRQPLDGCHVINIKNKEVDPMITTCRSRHTHEDTMSKDEPFLHLSSIFCPLCTLLLFFL